MAGAAVAGVYRYRRGQTGPQLPVARVRKGDFLEIVRSRGEIKASRSVQIVAPFVPSLRIVWTANGGSPVKAGDPVVRFDASNAQQQLAEKQAALEQAQATLDQAVAQERITLQQDERDIYDARHQVETARLEASKTEIVSRIQGEESKVDLAVAEEKLKVYVAAAELHSTSSKAKIASLTRQRDQARFVVNLIQGRLAQMELKAPISGVVVFAQNTAQGWVNAKPFRAGDQVWPAAVLGEIPSLDTIEMEGKVEEIDRGRIEPGMEARVAIDSLPELAMPAKLDRISPLTELSIDLWPPTRSFRAYARIQRADPRLRPAMNGQLDIITRRIPGALSIPARALFTRAGKPVVYVSGVNGYEPTEIQIQARNPDEVAITGVSANTLVALSDPEKKERKQ
jgi:multidrug efflux pump subunit AcrA (membrane-fusion protein)